MNANADRAFVLSTFNPQTTQYSNLVRHKSTQALLNTYRPDPFKQKKLLNTKRFCTRYIMQSTLRTKLATITHFLHQAPAA